MAVNNWIGRRMMNPDGKIGVVVDDSNGVFRVLDVKFEDNTIYNLFLSNTCDNPEESREWSWEYEKEGETKKWVKWGK